MKISTDNLPWCDRCRCHQDWCRCTPAERAKTRRLPIEIQIGPQQIAVLHRLAEAEYSEYSEYGRYCVYFWALAMDTGLTRKQVRRACRSLANKGLAEYIKGLMDEDGRVAGSGYCATTKGQVISEAIRSEESVVFDIAIKPKSV